jgi:hypothetical protein
VFRGKFVAALDALRCQGAFGAHPTATQPGWRALLAALYQHDWVVYAKQPLGGPAQVLEYLARYTHKTAISNDRLRGLHDGQVTFRVRDPTKPKTGGQASLPAGEFIDRFLTHVLPTGFKRIRHYGLLASRHKVQKLATCRALLNQPAPVPAVVESVADFMRRVAGIELSQCAHCTHGHMRVVAPLAPLRASRPRPSATGPPR